MDCIPSTWHKVSVVPLQNFTPSISSILFIKSEDVKKALELVDILLMDKGSQSYTAYTFDASVIEHMENNPELEECKMGHIHSHNTMSVFFSGTDMSELEDNSPNHNYYLSLIVNNFMDFCAKVCFIAQAENETFSFIAKDEIDIDIIGFIIQLKIEKSSFVTFKSLLALNEKLSVVLINKTIIKPSIPNIGINKFIISILTVISIKLYLNV